MKLVLHHTKKVTTSLFSILKKWWYIVLILVAVVGYFAYQNQTKNAKEVKTYTVKQETLKDILALSGEIDADEKVSLHFQSGGRLAWVGVKESDTVKQYQGIASLDQRQLQKNIEKYLNTYVKERNDFEQNLEDNGTGDVGFTQEIRDAAKRVYQNSQQDLNNTVLDVELQTISKEYAYLYSPINGIVTHVGAPAAGMNVAITDMYDIVNPETIYFAIAADQTEVVKLNEGMRGTIYLDSYPDEAIDGTVSAIAFTPTEGETGTVYEVKMAIPPVSAAKYRIGMTGDVEFILKEISGTVAIPLEYIVDENDKQFVFKQDNGKKVKVEIKTGNEYEGMIEVTNGLDAGDVIYEVET